MSLAAPSTVAVRLHLLLCWFEDCSKHRFIFRVVPVGANWLIKEWGKFEPWIPYRDIDYTCAGNIGNAPREKVACIAECDDLWTGSRWCSMLQVCSLSD